MMKIEMKNKSTLAKLLAEEDIFVVHKQMATAYFDAKKRELGLPIWKDEEMTPDIYELLIGHEIGHALWTPLEMLEEAAHRGINPSFVNIIEDARIEKKSKNKYPGLTSVFKRGYVDLVKKDFFGTAKKDIASYNLIDRINIFFKSGDATIPFSDDEKVWVKRVDACKTPDDVLDLAEELYEFMKENPETANDDMRNMSASGFGDENSDETSDSGSGNENSDETSANGSGDEEDKNEKDDTSAGDDENDSDDDTDNSSSSNSSNGGGVDSGPPDPTATTDDASVKGMDDLRDKNATNRMYARIPKVDLKKIVVDTKTLLDEFKGYYLNAAAAGNDSRYWDSTLEEVTALKNDSKKTVAYMVKEFEMKKAADQYARAAVSKTGSLDMAKLHTYKYNEDLFKKVTTLPGATNHGMVMVLDWSGSMGENLVGTLSQLYNLIWFCRRTQIPFEVFAFSDAYGRPEGMRTYTDAFVKEDYANEFKAGDIALHRFNLLNFFSSNMTVTDEMDMMHVLWMYANRWLRRDWSKGYPYSPPRKLSLGGTPLNDTIIAMMDLVPKFKNDTGVQKVNTIFLTDGESNWLGGTFDYKFDPDENEHNPVINKDHTNWKVKMPLVITDPVTNKTYNNSWGTDGTTSMLLRILKTRVSEMNVVGFFIAGSGKAGRVNKNTLYNLLPSSDSEAIMEKIKFLNKNNYLAITQLGYDEYYILPGGNALKTENETLDDKLVGASKAKLKSAFSKISKGKISSRQLLNKFVAMVT